MNGPLLWRFLTVATSGTASIIWFTYHDANALDTTDSSRQLIQQTDELLPTSLMLAIAYLLRPLLISGSMTISATGSSVAAALRCARADPATAKNLHPLTETVA